VENESIEEFLNNQVKEGYISENGTPLKCFKCESKEMSEVNHDYLDGGRILEYDIKCKDCDTIVGSWAYGHWQL